MLKTFTIYFGSFMILLVSLLGTGLYIFYTFGRGLPDYTHLKEYEPAVMTRVQAGDGRLLVEYLSLIHI